MLDGERERSPISSSSSSKRRFDAHEKTTRTKRRTNQRAAFPKLFAPPPPPPPPLSDFFGRVPSDSNSRSNTTPIARFLRNNFQKEKMIEKKNTQKSIKPFISSSTDSKKREREREMSSPEDGVGDGSEPVQVTMAKIFSVHRLFVRRPRSILTKTKRAKTTRMEAFSLLSNAKQRTLRKRPRKSSYSSPPRCGLCP